MTDVRQVWMLDFDDAGWPVRLHAIVATENAGQPDEVRVTACGVRATAQNHPRGWWDFPVGALPTGPDLIHCAAPRVSAGDVPAVHTGE